jgi:hypothetical protein
MKPATTTYDLISVSLLLVMLTGAAVGIGIRAGTGWDFANFYDAGHKVLARQIQNLYNPEAMIEGKSPEGNLAFYGTPLSALFYAAMAWMRPAQALVAFKIQNTIAIFSGLWLLYVYNRSFAEQSGFSRAAFRALFLLAALVYQPFWTVYRVGGQTTPTVFLCLVLGLICFTSGRLFLAAICLVLVVTIKPAFALMLIFLALTGGRRFLIYTLMTGIATAGASVLIMGWSVHERFLEHLAAGKLSPWLYNSSITVAFDMLRLAGVDTWPVIAAANIVRAGAAALVIITLLLSRKRKWFAPARQHFLFLMAIVFGLVLMPVVWEHYLSVLFIPLSYFVAFILRLGRSERILILSIFIACLAQNLILVMWVNDHLNINTPLALLAACIVKSAPLILFAVLLWRYREALFNTYLNSAWGSSTQLGTVARVPGIGATVGVVPWKF